MATGLTVNSRLSARAFSATVIIRADAQIRRMRGPLVPVSANRVWRQLPNEIRVAVCQISWAESKGTEKQFLCASLAKAKKLREVFVRKSPIERLVNWTAATLSLPDPIVDDLLKKYLLHEHRAVIVSFLDLLNIPHSEGMIEENFDYATLTNERVQEAARSLLASADRTGSELYLKYLVLQGGPWAGIEEVLPTGE
jgi:isoleucyl-tRNA synthetase